MLFINMWNLLCNIFSMGQGLQLTKFFTPLHNVPKNHQFHPKTFSTTSQNVAITIYTWISTFFWQHWVELDNVINTCKKVCPLLWYIPKHYPRKIFFFFFPSFTLCVVITTCQALGGELFSNSHGPLKTCPHHSLVCSKWNIHHQTWLIEMEKMLKIKLQIKKIHNVAKTKQKSIIKNMFLSNLLPTNNYT